MQTKNKFQHNEISSFEEFRRGFPALRAQTYLSICDKMILHDNVRAAVEEFLNFLGMASANRTEHEVRVTSSREKFARLMNVDPGTIAATRNVSDGVNSIAWAVQWKDGDNVVLSSQAEHPNNVYPWLRQKARGIEVRAVEPRPDGALDIDSMIAAIDSRTRVMTAASATFAPGHRTDLMKLGEACRKSDVLLLVDGVQTAGILHHSLSDEPVDAFATSASKGLLGLYGYGFLYVSPKWIDRLSPAYLSRASVVQATDDHSTMGSGEYEYQPDSRRFEVGSFNLAGAYAADASIGMLLDLGSEAIEKRVLRLGSMLHDGIAEAGITPAVPGSGPQQSHIVTLGRLDAGGHGFSTDPLITPLSKHLTERRIAHTIRRGQLRFGLHAYNDESDVEQAVVAIREGMAEAQRAAG
ncbi:MULTISPECIES: aminotransferase class V-fold PLP-dependent enzyme [unclassified Aurantimonas]|uniref:aminotransferase class V-fold PLP-dependent enzyme n=1 Tax=unclassified Aurantimonas TaxID=2638230 RepID=UPI002E19A1F3|nr:MULTISPECIES: aminotransferase class V-fold PLP-dependent enzyme [unclassified Aurantimonas]MEC5292802.1 aminotransferase class V-fold PLP-dependent enzyme [Aurantimonas sp. C2-3-R2]MEC5413854.1 aminotransferase class V-fold PLP-dependent enzyme [Aurantimonas sp. C2-4-R8]